MRDRKTFTLKSKLYRSPDNSDIFFTLAVSLGMVRSRATKGDSIVLQEFTDVSGHECCSSISVNKGGQPKDGKRVQAGNGEQSLKSNLYKEWQKGIESIHLLSREGSAVKTPGGQVEDL